MPLIGGPLLVGNPRNLAVIKKCFGALNLGAFFGLWGVKNTVLAHSSASPPACRVFFWIRGCKKTFWLKSSASLPACRLFFFFF